ncbi:olfactory receptor 1500-like [Hyla sarda]|uniref:olfactory receptor 1500-like n=1 Tax=Hyla sarda TaxID=327740 RepID=UPI0024C32E8E|nr:olfactory receptor 1500-like [Hyla sarda]
MIHKNMANESVFEFVLVGFPGLPEKYHIGFGILIFLIYYLSLCANLTVILLIFLKKHLHQPMYIIILNLAFSDLLFDTSTLPNIIAKYWFGAGSMTFAGCFLQMTIVHTLNSLDSFIITFMAIDRYVAICKPLRYHAIVSNRFIRISLVVLYVLALVIGFTVLYLMLGLPYIGSNKVNNLFCSMGAVIGTTYVDPAPTHLKGYYMSFAVHVSPFFFIIVSYCVIITNICSSIKSSNWNKAFYTCMTHWFVIVIYYVPRMIVYTFEQIQKPQVDVYISLICLYTFVPHSTSPIIFCLRNEEIKRTLKSILKRENNF